MGKTKSLLCGKFYNNKDFFFRFDNTLLHHLVHNYDVSTHLVSMAYLEHLKNQALLWGVN